MEKIVPKWKYGNKINFTSPSRVVNTIFIHCSASDVESHDDISVMKRWHMVDNNWSRVGYHFFINKSGNIHEGCPIEKIPIAQKGHNTGSIAICLHGLKKSKFTSQQLISVKSLCDAIADSYDKKIRIRGHKEVSAKACPVFDYKTTLNLDSEGYYNDNNAAAVSSTIATEKSEPDTTVLKISKKLNPLWLTSQGQAVKALQNLLKKSGYPCSNDGLFGQNTAQNIKSFQRKKGLIADAIVGAKTINVMFSSNKLLLKKISKGTDVKVLQLLLTMYGKSIMHDGIFGSGTEKALQGQQKLFGIISDGIFGAVSRKKMLN